MAYETLYEIRPGDYDWTFPLSGVAVSLVFLFLFAQIVVLRRLVPGLKTGALSRAMFFPGWRYRRLVFVVAIAGGPVWSAGVTAATYSKHSTAIAQLHSGTCHTVEGPIERFVPMTSLGRKREEFSVAGIAFEYSQYWSDPGFKQTTEVGGRMRLGLPVRICYWQMPSGHRAILRLEARR